MPGRLLPAEMCSQSPPGRTGSGAPATRARGALTEADGRWGAARASHLCSERPHPAQGPHCVSGNSSPTVPRGCPSETGASGYGRRQAARGRRDAAGGQVAERSKATLASAPHARLARTPVHLGAEPAPGPPLPAKPPPRTPPATPQTRAGAGGTPAGPANPASHGAHPHAQGGWPGRLAWGERELGC